MLLNHLPGVHGVAKAFAHLVAILVEHQSVRYDVLERHRVEQQRGQGV